LLIIDDNAAVRATLKLLLSDEFEEVTAIENPSMIATLSRPGSYDAVLLDMNFDSGALDCRDGLFWLERLKSLPNPPAIVVITAFGDVDIAVKAMKLGAEDFVTKPWNNEQLLDKLKKAIVRNRQMRQDKEAARRTSELEEAENERLNLTLDEVKMRHVRSVIDSCGGNLSAAAQQLGVNRQTLYNLLKK
ncbi:MAG: response regulator, partial [Muribaculaceae bacterium]|nr:response regulator [Muribaculaceae bacterium]